MSIARESGRMQICCDSCPASYPNTYEPGDFDVTVSDARTAGWTIRKAPVDTGRERNASDLFGKAPRIAGNRPRSEPYIHSCPDCAADRRAEGRML